MTRLFTFKHIESNLYEIHDIFGPMYVGRMYGSDAFVVDKYRTTMVTKRTTNDDRFFKANVETFDTVIEWWFIKTGPTETRAMPQLCLVLYDVAEHHSNFIAKLIVE